MYAAAVKPKKENKSRAAANSVAQKKNNKGQGIGFVDNRPEAVAQRKLQAVANHSPHAMQVKGIQDMANNSPKSEQAAKLHGFAFNSDPTIQNISSVVIQRGTTDDFESDYEFGLMYGKHNPENNTAEMHVHQKGAEQFRMQDVYNAFKWVHKKMVKCEKETGISGILEWEPMGAAVVKMIAELFAQLNVEMDEERRPALLHAEDEKRTRKQRNEQDNIQTDLLPKMHESVIEEHTLYWLASVGVEGINVLANMPGEDGEEIGELLNVDTGPTSILAYAEVLREYGC